MNHQNLRIAKTIVNDNNLIGAIKIPDIVLYYRSVIENSIVTDIENKYINQLNRVVDPVVISLPYCQMILTKKIKNICWIKANCLTNGASKFG